MAVLLCSGCGGGSRGVSFEMYNEAVARHNKLSERYNTLVKLCQKHSPPIVILWPDEKPTTEPTVNEDGVCPTCHVCPAYCRCGPQKSDPPTCPPKAGFVLVKVTGFWRTIVRAG